MHRFVSNYSEMKQLKRKSRQFFEPHFTSATVRDAKAKLKKIHRFVEKKFKHHTCYETTNTMEFHFDLLHEISKIRIDYNVEEINIAST